MFADELSCLSFWMVDNKDSGAVDFEKFNDLLTAFRFEVKDLEGFKTEFSSLLNQRELKSREVRGDSPVLRFDLMRQIFLERGL